jgi:hypothetical protein
MKSRIRPNKYKKILFPAELLKQNAAELWPQLSLIQHKWQSGDYHESQIVAEYLLCFLQKLRPRLYQGARHNPPLSSLTFNDAACRVFNDYSLRSIPLAASKALIAWAENKIQLKLTDQIPTAYEMLKLQAQGARYVTCFFDKKNIFDFPENGRDPFVFTIHDLIHADHFFGDAQLALEQKIFYQEILTRFEAGEFQPLMQNLEFNEKLEYLIGDMNSHPTHLHQTLNHIMSAHGEEKTEVLLGMGVDAIAKDDAGAVSRQT